MFDLGLADIHERLGLGIAAGGKGFFFDHLSRELGNLAFQTAHASLFGEVANQMHYRIVPNCEFGIR